MKTETATARIDRPAEEVWGLLGEFGGLETWLPGVEACVVDGDVRRVDTMGMTIEERLVDRNEAARVITYSIVSGAPVDTHEATITVVPVGAGSCDVTWSVSTNPHDAAGFMRDVYQGALDSVKAQLEA